MKDRKTVLVVEPDEVCREIIRQGINGSPINLVFASDAQQAARRLRASRKQPICTVAIAEDMRGGFQAALDLAEAVRKRFDGGVFVYGDDCNHEIRLGRQWTHRNGLMGALIGAVDHEYDELRIVR